MSITTITAATKPSYDSKVGFIVGKRLTMMVKLNRSMTRESLPARIFVPDKQLLGLMEHHFKAWKLTKCLAAAQDGALFPGWGNEPDVAVELEKAHRWTNPSQEKMIYTLTTLIQHEEAVNLTLIRLTSRRMILCRRGVWRRVLVLFWMWGSYGS